MLDPGASTDTPVRRQGPGRSLPGPTRAIPCTVRAVTGGSDEDQGAEVPTVVRDHDDVPVACPIGRLPETGREMVTRTRASRCRQLGTTLGATGMNNFPVLRTRLDNTQ
jgi:hypothetical protein